MIIRAKEPCKQLILTVVETPHNIEFIKNTYEFIQWYVSAEKARIDNEEFYVVDKELLRLWDTLIGVCKIITEYSTTDSSEILASVFANDDDKLYKELSNRLGKISIRAKAEIINSSKFLRLSEETRLQAKSINIAVSEFDKTTAWHAFRQNKEILEQSTEEAMSLIDSGRDGTSNRFLLNGDSSQIGQVIDNFEAVSKVRLKTGLNIIDDIHGGLKMADLICGYSISGGGKSVFSTNLAYQIRQHNSAKCPHMQQLCGNLKPTIVIFTHEVTAREYFMNILALYVGQKQVKKYAELQGTELANVAKKYMVGEDDDFAITVIDIAANAMSDSDLRAELDKEIKYGRKPVLVIDDYLELIKQDNHSKTPLGDIAQGLKNVAKDYSCAVFTTHQLSNGQIIDMEDFSGADIINCFSPKHIANDKSVRRKLDLELMIFKTVYRSTNYLGIKITKVRTGAALTRPDGRPRVAAIPYGEGDLYKTGDVEYDSILDVPGVLGSDDISDAFAMVSDEDVVDVNSSLIDEVNNLSKDVKEDLTGLSDGVDTLVKQLAKELETA